MKTLLRSLWVVSAVVSAVVSTTGIHLRAANSEIALKIIVNSARAASQVSDDDVTRIFLMTKTSLSDGSNVEPVLQREGVVYHAFLKRYIGKTDSALTAYYRTLVFTGKASMPKRLDSDAEVVAYVARNRGAIGFVNANSNISSVKTLKVK